MVSLTEFQAAAGYAGYGRKINSDGTVSFIDSKGRIVATLPYSSSSSSSSYSSSSSSSSYSSSSSSSSYSSSSSSSRYSSFNEFQAAAGYAGYGRKINSDGTVSFIDSKGRIVATLPYPYYLASSLSSGSESIKPSVVETSTGLVSTAFPEDYVTESSSSQTNPQTYVSRTIVGTSTGLVSTAFPEAYAYKTTTVTKEPSLFSGGKVTTTYYNPTPVQSLFLTGSMMPGYGQAFTSVSISKSTPSITSSFVSDVNKLYGENVIKPITEPLMSASLSVNTKLNEWSEKYNEEDVKSVTTSGGAFTVPITVSSGSAKGGITKIAAGVSDIGVGALDWFREKPVTAAATFGVGGIFGYASRSAEIAALAKGASIGKKVVNIGFKGVGYAGIGVFSLDVLNKISRKNYKGLGASLAESSMFVGGAAVGSSLRTMKGVKKVEEETSNLLKIGESKDVGVISKKDVAPIFSVAKNEGLKITGIKAAPVKGVKLAQAIEETNGIFYGWRVSKPILGREKVFSSLSEIPKGKPYYRAIGTVERGVRFGGIEIRSSSHSNLIFTGKQIKLLGNNFFGKYVGFGEYSLSALEGGKFYFEPVNAGLVKIKKGELTPYNENVLFYNLMRRVKIIQKSVGKNRFDSSISELPSWFEGRKLFENKDVGLKSNKLSNKVVSYETPSSNGIFLESLNYNINENMMNDELPGYKFTLNIGNRKYRIKRYFDEDFPFVVRGITVSRVGSSSFGKFSVASIGGFSSNKITPSFNVGYFKSSLVNVFNGNSMLSNDVRVSGAQLKMSDININHIGIKNNFVDKIIRRPEIIPNVEQAALEDTIFLEEQNKLPPSSSSYKKLFFNRKQNFNPSVVLLKTSLFFGKGQGETLKRNKRNYSYVPSLTSILFNIRSKRKQSVTTTGFDVRPIIISNINNKRKGGMRYKKWRRRKL